MPARTHTEWTGRVRCAVLAVAGAGLAASTLVVAAPPVRADVSTVTEFAYSSTAGDWVGGGAQALYTPATATFHAVDTPATVTSTVATPTSTWSIVLAAPVGQILRPGVEYDGATSIPSLSTTQASMSVSSHALLGECNYQLSGSFVIHSLEELPGGQVASLDASFTQRCTRGTGTLTGEIRINAVTAVSIAQSARAVAQGQTVVYGVGVDPAGRGAASGQVTLWDGWISLGSGLLSDRGTMGIAEALPVGTHLIRAQYGGDGVHQAGYSAFIVTVVQPSSPTTTQFSETSEAGSLLGHGLSGTYTAPTSTFEVVWGNGSGAQVMISGPHHTWYVEIEAPNGQRLQPGTYTASRAPFQTGTDGGLSVEVDSSGCNNAYGSFTVYAIGTDATGKLQYIDFSFVHHCEWAEDPPITGSLQYAAPVPDVAPAVTLSAASTADTGQAVALTTRVTPPAGSATGAVIFTDGLTTLGSATLDASGTAALSVDLSTGGAHALTAVYTGDATNAAATSPIAATWVRYADSTAVTAAPSPALAGTPVALVATVTAAGGATPQGMVTFLDGTAALGQVALTNGVAVLSTSTLSPGAHLLAARYSGSSTDMPNMSAPALLTVTAAP